ncbi:helix-turn-helix transcriptional regulator [Endozoicomonas sp. G2_1]|uniref:AraC family transcriptional regulator n=1 Tax=Endozoicomonas sp. G2_1 TaxID=2821091 RepID=UPI001ADA0B5A|nr:helix-turn-helix transcriptional regulator [Endozoicomonas sp. G2_1]MBO9489427.1 helix-turn-helix transcriptional regulator [Endozoicomonas sp. G2_1]
MNRYIDNVSRFTEIPPSKESNQAEIKPITVINRAIGIDSVVKKHKHDWGQFIYANSGVLSVVTDSSRYIVPPEQGVWVLPNINHEVSAITDVELTSFYFGNEVQDKLPKQSCVLAVNNFLKTLIVEAKQTKPNYHWSDSDGLLLRLIVEKLNLAPTVVFQLPYPRDKRLITMLTMLQQQPANRNSLVEWGQIVGASSRTLSRLFKAETGLDYSTWRQRLYVQLAISKLAQGHSITAIAAELGYESPSAFIYMFKENTGVTPSHYRAEN